MRHGQADIAAAHDHQPLLLVLGLAEDLERAGDILDRGEDIGLVMGEKLVARFRREEPPVAADAHHDDPQGGKEVVQLPQGRVENRAILVQPEPHELALVAQEHLGVEGRGRRQPLQGGVGHLALGADHHVDGHVVAAVEVGIDRVEIGLAAQPGNLALDGKDRMRDLAGDHVHLVRIGRGDDHVGIARPGPVEHVGVAGEAVDPLHVQRFGGPADKVGVVVDHRDVVLLAAQMAGDLPAHLAGPADDDLHGRPLSCRRGF